MLTIAKGKFVSAAEWENLPKINYVSIYRGPILLTYDARFNDTDFRPESVPQLANPNLKLLSGWKKVPSNNPLILVEGNDVKGKPVRYCDFASAGATGNYYQSWVPVKFNCKDVKFSPKNPCRSQTK